MKLREFQLYWLHILIYDQLQTEFKHFREHLHFKTACLFLKTEEKFKWYHTLK